jgi:hypothetical protein
VRQAAVRGRRQGEALRTALPQPRPADRGAQPRRQGAAGDRGHRPAAAREGAGPPLPERRRADRGAGRGAREPGGGRGVAAEEGRAGRRRRRCSDEARPAAEQRSLRALAAGGRSDEGVRLAARLLDRGVARRRRRHRRDREPRR